jgi:uncharacterized protein (TIGR02246 family)
MPSQEQIRQWVDGYRTAWESNDPEDIGRLFTEQALYYTEPHAEPWRSRQEIVDRWIGIKDEPGDTEFSWDLVATDGDLAIVQAQTIYHDPRSATATSGSSASPPPAKPPSSPNGG